MIEIDNEMIYVCGDGKSWSNDDPVKVYETYDEAVEEILKIEEEMSLRYELPADGYVG